MSDYTYLHESTGGPNLEISRIDELPRETWIGPNKKGGIGSYIRNSDAPKVAAELLKAAGYAELAELIETTAAKKKLQERRDALLREFKAGALWSHTSELAQLAIDRIIELEDGQAK